MKKLRKIISIVIILSIVLSLFGGCSINEVKQFTLDINGENIKNSLDEHKHINKDNNVEVKQLGSSTCDWCYGSGESTSSCSSCKNSGHVGQVICSACSGYGSKKCSACNGLGSYGSSQGSYGCKSCNGSGSSFEGNFVNGQGRVPCAMYVTCSSCGGSGTTTRNCYNCSGSGMVTYPEIIVPGQPVIPNSLVVGQNQEIKVSAKLIDGSGTITYQWYNNDVLISGATLATYNLSLLAVGTHKLKCRLSAPNASNVFTKEATITVLPKPVLTITQQPLSQNIIIGENKIVSVTATVANGLGVINYQWYNNDVLIPGATSSTYNLSSLPVGTHKLKCVISSTSADDIVSTLGTVVVAAKPVITINTEPINKEFFVGETVSISVGATIANKVKEISYQWFDGATAIANANTSTLDVSSLSVGTHQIKCELTSDFADKKTTRIVIITVKAKPVLSFSTQPISKEFYLGEVHNLTVVANLINSTNPIAYKWYNGASVIANANTATLDLSSLAIGTHQIKCEISSANALTVTSNIVTVTVKKRPVITITKQPEDKTIVVGSDESITVIATVPEDNAPLSYQWKNDETVIEKANNETLALKNLPIGTHNVKCVLSSDDYAVVSDIATIVVTPSFGGGGTVPTPTPTVSPVPTPTPTVKPTSTPTVSPLPTEKPVEPVVPVEPTPNFIEVIITSVAMFFQIIIDFFAQLFT